MASNSTPFIPKHLVVLSELDTKEKEKYYNIMLNNHSKFHRSENGQYILNMRILAPGMKKHNNNKQKEQVTNSLPFEERLQRLKEDKHVTVTFAGKVEEFDYSSYPRFSVLIANDGDTVSPRPKLLSWLMRAIEEIYDARFAHEAAEVGRGECDFVAEQVSNLFPAFVVKRLSTRVGLRSLVDQTCWDLLYNSHVYRRDYLEVEMFCRFLQEFYDHDDLLFFLYVRSVVAKQLHVSFKTRWTKNDGPSRQPKSLWLSYRECVHVAKTVFGEGNEGMCRDFLSIVLPQMVGQKGGPQQQDSRRIDITQFLHLAVVGYHQTRPEDQQDDPQNYERQSTHNQDNKYGSPPLGMPPNAPSGGDYMSRFSSRTTAEVPDMYPSNMYSNQDDAREFSEDDAYLSRLQRDREELQQMQQNFGNEDDYYNERFGGDDLFGDIGFDDPLINNEESNMALTDLAAEKNTQSRTPAKATGGQSLADFARQRQELARVDDVEPSDTSSRDSSENEEDLSDIQREREHEFLEIFCESVRKFPEDIATSIIEELADRLHHKLSTALAEQSKRLPSGLPQDPDEFDEVVVHCLQDDALQADMAAARELMLNYVKDRME